MAIRWRRPYPPGPYRVVAAGLLLFGCGLLAFATFRILGEDIGDAVVGLGVVWTLVGLWCAVVWRLYRLGVYVSARGLRVVNPVRTTTLPWGGVERLYLGPARLAMLGGFGPDTRAVWVKPVGGASIQTVLHDASADFRFRRHALTDAFEQLRQHQRAATGR